VDSFRRVATLQERRQCLRPESKSLTGFLSSRTSIVVGGELERAGLSLFKLHIYIINLEMLHPWLQASSAPKLAESLAKSTPLL